ncbi:MAG: PaaI family thioesterase [Pseudomonadota bacterium]
MTENSIEVRIRDSFERQTMMATFSASLDHVSEGRVVISAPVLLECRQQHGAAHAALTFGLGDSAAGYAALTLGPAGTEVMTAEMKINLLAPGLGDSRLRATGKVIKPGRRLIVVAAEIHAIDGETETLIAIMQGTMVPVAP